MSMQQGNQGLQIPTTGSPYQSQTQGRGNGGGTSISRQQEVAKFETVIPSRESFAQLAQQLQSQPGIREVTLLPEGRTPRVRVRATAEAIPHLQNVWSQLQQQVQAYAQSGSSF